MKLTDYQEIPEIDWHRRVMIGGWCVLVGFVIAVCLVTGFIYLFDPHHGDGRDPFMKEVIQQQNLSQ